MSFSTNGETDPSEEIVPDDRTPADLHPTIIGVLGRESRGRLQVSPLGRLRRVCSVVLPAFRDRAATPNPLSLDIDIDVNVDVQSVCPTE